MTLALLTPDAIEEACSADRVRRTPWLRMTRADCAVRAGRVTVHLHGYRGTFDLWQAASWPNRGDFDPLEAASWPS